MHKPHCDFCDSHGDVEDFPEWLNKALDLVECDHICRRCHKTITDALMAVVTNCRQGR